MYLHRTDLSRPFSKVFKVKVKLWHYGDLGLFDKAHCFQVGLPSCVQDSTPRPNTHSVCLGGRTGWLWRLWDIMRHHGTPFRSGQFNMSMYLSLHVSMLYELYVIMTMMNARCTHRDRHLRDFKSSLVVYRCKACSIDFTPFDLSALMSPWL